MVCVKCGQVNEGTKFCTKCGANFVEQRIAKSKDMIPGRLLLKVTGILIIVFAVFGIIGVISTIALLPTYADLGVDILDIHGGRSGMILSIIFGTINAILLSVLGISNIKYSKNLDRAKQLMIFVIVVIAWIIVSHVVTHSITKDYSWTSLIGLLIGFIFPVLSLIGAYKNFKAKGDK